MDKRCKHCGATKPIDDFHRDSAARDGHRPECKGCTAARRKARYSKDPKKEIARVKAWQDANRERHLAYQRERRQRPEVKARNRDAHLRRKFGITAAQYDAMLALQGGRCAICRCLPTEGISLHVDHDHETGANRKLLSFKCNNALGDFGDDPALLRKAIAYLDAHDPEVAELTARTRERLAALRG